MNQKELSETLMIISNWKNLHGLYKNILVICRLKRNKMLLQDSVTKTTKRLLTWMPVIKRTGWIVKYTPDFIYRLV